MGAFFNTCRHRGAPVATAAQRRPPAIHLSLSRLELRPRRRALGCATRDFNNLDLQQRGLDASALRGFGNLMFVNFDTDAPSLLEWLGPIAAEWEEFQFDNCRLAARHVFDLDCNWKIAMEANTEVYHVRTIHPTTVAPVLDDRRNVNTLYPNGHGRMVAPTPAGKQTLEIMPVDPRIAQIDTVGEIGRTCTQSYGVFPNLVAPLSQYVIPPLVFWPNGINQCRMETWTLRHRLEGGPAPGPVDRKRRRKIVRGAARGHPVRRENSEVDGIARLQGRAAQLPGGAHLPLEPGRRPHDRHRQHSAGTARGTGDWRGVDVSQRPAPAFAEIIEKSRVAAWTAGAPRHQKQQEDCHVETKKTFCRFCHVFCGLEVDVQDNRVIAVRGDHDNPVSEGYTCPKGRAEAERINHPERLRRSLKSVDGGFAGHRSLQATAEIGAKLKRIVAEHGPEAVAVYVGCGGHRTAAGGPWYVAKWLQAFGSPRLYTSLTIDSPSLIIAYDRLFGGPLPLSVFDIDRADSAMFVATNPVVSHLWSMPQSNPPRA